MDRDSIFVQPEQHRWQILFLIGSVLVFMYTVYHFYGDQLFPGPTEVAVEFPYNGEGTIVFSAAHPEASTDGRPLMGSYQIDAANITSGYTDLFSTVGINNKYFTDASLSTGFVVYADDNLSTEEELRFGIGRISVIDREEPRFDIQPLVADGWYERHISYSEAQQKLAYITTEREYHDLETFQSADNWGINIYNLVDNTRSVVANGVSPAWYKDTNSFFYINRDGIHFYNNEENLSSFIKTINSQAPTQSGSDRITLSTELAVTPDGEFLIVTSPYGNAIQFYRISEEPTGANSSVIRLVHQGTHRAEPGTVHFSPLTSPDGAYFAVHTVTHTPPRFEQWESMQVQIGSIEDQVILHSIDVSTFIPESFFLDSWQ